MELQLFLIILIWITFQPGFPVQTIYKGYANALGI